MMDGQSPLSRFFTRRSMLGLLGLESFAILGLILALLAANSPQRQQQSTPAGQTSSFPTIVPSFTPTATLDPTQTPVTSTAPITAHAQTGNWLALSMNDGGYAHLFAFAPQSLPLTRLTANPWDDITPAVSPDGTKIAYSSRQNGFWDLYILDLQSGAQTRLTDTPEYDAAPTWSPDGLWIAYETYAGDDLEIAVRSVASPADAPLMLTDDPAADHSPAWAPDGRHLAFVSDRSGENDVWLANLDQTDQRFTNLSADPRQAQAHPAWSPNGSKLAWASSGAGGTFIDIWDSAQPTAQPIRLGEGLWPAWSPTADTLVTSVVGANQAYLSGYTQDALLAFSSIPLPGNLYGFSWASTDFPVTLPPNLQAAGASTPSPLWTDLPTPAENPTARNQVVALAGIEAPHPFLLDQVTPSFLALRSRLIVDAGWDVFAALDSAYVPLTDALPPGYEQDWAYTGRSFSISSTTLSAGWINITQEYIGGQLYWRVYARAYYQDGSQGTPLPNRFWDLNARSAGDPVIYDQGGALASAAPGGYWVDVTDLAQRFSWERLPALSNWRTYYAGTRYNTFIKTDGKDWQTAMLDLYPPEALVSPTAVVPPTATPTRAPAWYKSPTPGSTAEPTVTPTPRPTWTPLPPAGQ